MIKINNKSDRVLVTHNIDWADEISFQDSLPMFVRQQEDICERAKLAFAKYKTCTQHVGTNQEIEYSSYENWLSTYTVKEITVRDYNTLKRFKGYLTNYKFFIPEYYEEDPDR